MTNCREEAEALLRTVSECQWYWVGARGLERRPPALALVESALRRAWAGGLLEAAEMCEGGSPADLIRAVAALVTSGEKKP